MSFPTLSSFAGEAVELSDVDSFIDEFSWATSHDGLHKHHTLGIKTQDTLAIVSGFFTIGKPYAPNEDA